MKLKLPSFCEGINPKILNCIKPILDRLGNNSLPPYVILLEGSRYSGKSQGMARLVSALIMKKAVLSCLIGSSVESGMAAGFSGLVMELTGGKLKGGGSKSLSSIINTPAKIDLMGFHKSRGEAVKDLNTHHDIVVMDEMGAWGEKVGIDAIKTLYRDGNARIIIVVANRLPNWIVEWGETLEQNCNYFRIDYWENKKLPKYLFDQLEKEKELHPAMWKAKTLFASDDIDGTPFISATALEYIFTEYKGSLPESIFRCVSIDVGGELGDPHCIVKLWQAKDKSIFWNVHKLFNSNYPILSQEAMLARAQMGATNEIWDADGVGNAALDFRCPKEMRYESNIIEFRGGGKPKNSDYFNARSEAYFNVAKLGEMNMLHFVGDKVVGKQARVEFGATTVYPKDTAKGLFRINDKTVIKRFLSGESPNIADAVVMGVWLCLTRPQNSDLMSNIQQISTSINHGYIG